VRVTTLLLLHAYDRSMHISYYLSGCTSSRWYVLVRVTTLLLLCIRPVCYSACNDLTTTTCTRPYYYYMHETALNHDGGHYVVQRHQLWLCRCPPRPDLHLGVWQVVCLAALLAMNKSRKLLVKWRIQGGRGTRVIVG
jgi:hypothetical protein